MKDIIQNNEDFATEWALETQAIRAGQQTSQFGEHSQAIFLTSSFVASSAAEAAALFCGEKPGYIYARFTNPTVTAFQERLAMMEGAERCVATASGMSAILAAVMAHVSAGDHILVSQSVFGSTMQLFNTILARFAVQVTYAVATDLDSWRSLVQPNTKLFFLETPTNPLTEVADIAAIADIAHQNGAYLLVDNCFCSPVLQQPLKLGADLVLHSATKYLDGQGRVLGGAVCGSAKLIEPVYLFLRTAGPTLSAFNAWVILKGMETLKLRMDAQSAAALALATWLEQQPQVNRVYYPALPSHPQHAVAMRQQRTGGAIVAFEVKGGREAAWRLIDATKMLSITANLGDVKTTITHPYTTTHGRVPVAAKEAAGISEGLIRLAVGLEAVADIQADLLRGFSA